MYNEICTYNYFLSVLIITTFKIIDFSLFHKCQRSEAEIKYLVIVLNFVLPFSCEKKEYKKLLLL